MIQQHLKNFRTDYLEIVNEIEKSLYVDDLISGGKNENEAEQLKSKSTEIFADATVSLHKWHSNVLVVRWMGQGGATVERIEGVE